MINARKIAYKHSTRAAGLAAVTLSEYTNFLLLETLVEPVDAAPKSNRSSTKDAPVLKVCKVYPNPSAGIFLVEIPPTFEQVTLRITDGNGKLIYENLGVNGVNSVNLRPAASGTYQLLIMDEGGRHQESHTIQIVQ